MQLGGTNHVRRVEENGQPAYSSSSIVAMPRGNSAPVDTPDLAIIGVSTVVEVTFALVTLHVAAYRRWPGYAAKNSGLLLYTALAVSLSRDIDSSVFALFECGSKKMFQEALLPCCFSCWGLVAVHSR